MKNEILQIDLIYDIICPWCFVGHTRLLNAVKNTNTRVSINLIPFQIRPSIPEIGIDIETYWKDKGVTNVLKAYENVAEAAAAENLEIHPDKFSRIPNTLKIHQLILKAEEKGNGLRVLHTLQKAYFSQGSDLTLLPVLITLLSSYLTAKEVKEAWNSKELRDLVLEKEKEVKNKKITTVPTYIIANKFKLFGAVSNYKLKDMLTQLAFTNVVGESCDITGNEC